MNDDGVQPADERSSNRSRGFRVDGLGGRPTLATGEPVLARWFVLLLLVAVPLGLAITAWSLASIGRDQIAAAERRPPGTVQYTHERGRAVLAESLEVEAGPACAVGVTLVGDEGGRATGRRALQTLCDALGSDPDGELAAVAEGLRAWQVSGGRLRIAVFELTGVDASSRVEDGAVVIELNAKFQFDDAAEVMPMLAHELVHLADGWPLAPVTAEQELAAMRAQAGLCGRLVFRGEAPRGCGDALELTTLVDPIAALVAARYATG